MTDPNTAHELTARERQLTDQRRQQWLQGLRAQRELQEILSVIAEARGFDAATVKLSEDGTRLYRTHEEAENGDATE